MNRRKTTLYFLSSASNYSTGSVTIMKTLHVMTTLFFKIKKKTTINFWNLFDVAIGLRVLVISF